MEAPVASRPFAIQSSQLKYHTERARQFIDLTDQLLAALAQAGTHNGLATVTSQHTTAAIVINEYEPELLKDLDEFLQRLAPEGNTYAHNALPCPPSEQPNGHSHCQGLLLNSTVSIPVVDGRLVLGQWQRVFLVELDCPRPRRVTVTILGA